MNHTQAEYLDAVRAARDFLRYVCRYEYLHGDDEVLHNERPNACDTILFARLGRQLRRLNPERSESELQRASRALHLPAPANLAAAQGRLHALLFQRTAREDLPPVRYFDFERVSNNDLLVVEQFQVLGGGAARYPIDLAVFVNGIPLALVLCGDTNSAKGLQAAVRQFRQLQSPYAVPLLFHLPQILLAAQKDFAAAAMAGAEERDFKTWDEASSLTWEELRAALRLMPRRESELPTAQDVMLAGLLSPNALLTLLQNFTRFEQRGAKLARVHQYQAVQQAMAYLRASGPAKSAGIISHPGNSGKAHTLAWLLCEARALPAFTAQPLVLLTACARQRELAHIACAQQGLEAPRELLEPEQLALSLRRDSGRVLLLAPEVFQQAVRSMNEKRAASSLSEKAFLLLVDEINRVDYDALPLELRQAFPNAVFLALTASAPLKNSATPLIHCLTPAQALHRGYSLPIKFEARLPRLHHQLQPHTPSASVSSALAARRIAALAEDLHEHFSQEIYSNACKGLVLAANPQEAALYFQALEKKLGARVAIMLPKPQPHEKTLAALFRRFAPYEELAARWRDPQNELALLVLAERISPDLRTPLLQALYVDRPLRGHELLQTLALVQTPGSANKLFGVMVDYYGVTQSLPHELARFEFERAEEILAPRFSEKALAELRALRRELRALFKSYREAEASEAWLFALEAPELRRTFIKLWRDFARALDPLLPSLQEDFTFMQEVVWLDHVRQQAAAFYFDEDLAHAPGTRKVRQVLDTLAREQGIMRVRDMAKVRDESFLEEIAALSSVQAQVLRLQYALMEEIKQNLERDPAFYQVLHRRVSSVVIARRQKQIDDATALQQLREEALRLRAGALAPHANAQLSPEAQAYWRVLARYLAPPQSEHGRYEELAVRLLATLEPDTHIVDWTIKEDWQREMRRKIKHLLREVDCPQDLLDPLTQAVMQLTKARFGPAQAGV